jgi:hypothetical protein
MFKTLFEFLYDKEVANLKYIEEIKEKGYRAVYEFFKYIHKFAFFEDLNKLLKQTGTSIESEVNNHRYQNILKYLLTPDGLNYGNLPKGLLKFHNYFAARTPVEEHLVEGARYGISKGKVNIHFTVSPEHRKGFEQLINEVKEIYEKRFNIVYKLTFSEQKPSTDTIAVDLNNQPFRNDDQSVLFRPGGHGALIENLNDLQSQIIFIKNIDNVVPENYLETTITYKKVLAGVLLYYQDKIFDYLRQLHSETGVSDALIEEIGKFLHKELCIIPAEKFSPKSKVQRIEYLIEKLDRPLRVCGMVENVGEPGGGPFWATNQDGTVSLQVVESSQIDPDSPEKEEIVHGATHFNPVDLVCSVVDFKGGKFDLLKFIDANTGFISQKSKDGRELKALELPGLWNGAMSNWNTIFVEVPIETFNPVKIVNDLLRKEHQS